MNTIQIFEHELGKFKAISADVSITPNLSEFTWVEFYKATGPDRARRRGSGEGAPADQAPAGRTPRRGRSWRGRPRAAAVSVIQLYARRLGSCSRLPKSSFH